MDQAVARHRRYSWMPSGWFMTKHLASDGGGTAVAAVPCPDDFFAVRVGFANVLKSPWRVSKIIACSSSCFNDYINPLDDAGLNRPGSDWVTLTAAMAGTDDPRIVTEGGAPTEHEIAGNSVDVASGDTENAAFTWTDWAPHSSCGSRMPSGMRVLMLRILLPSNQTITFANGFGQGMSNGFTADPGVNKGYDMFTGGVIFNHDLISDPAVTQAHPFTTRLVADNGPTNGPVSPIVQFLTKRPGVVGMITGDSHHMGTSTTSQFNNFLVQCLLPLGAMTVGKAPIGLVNCAVSGMTSRRFIPRLTALLSAVRPGLVVLPGWSFNDGVDETNAGARASTEFLARILGAAEEVRAIGAVPIFLTPFPRNADDMTSERMTSWLALRQSILDLRSTGELVADATPVLGHESFGALDGTYLGKFTTDTIHPNDAGHAAVASILAPIVRQIAGL